MINSIRFILLTIVFITGVPFSGNTKRAALSDTPVKRASKYPNMEVTPDLTPDQMWKALCEYVPLGVTVTSLSIDPPIHWLRKQCGSYKYIPPILNVQMKDGIILTSGLATNCLGPNSQTGITKDHGTMNTDPDLNNAITYTVMDPAVFEIKFTSDKTIPGFSFVFCFGTDEYDEFVNTQFNDVFICMFDGKNICFDSQGKLICVNNTFFNVDNKDGHLNLEYDGLTCVLQTSQVIIPGNHTIKFAIADASDGKLDAGVFLNNFRFDTTITGTTPVINIIDNQQFAIPENTPGGSLVGAIAMLCTYGPVSLQKINTVPEFYCSGWNITVSNGVVFNASVTNQYVMKIKATLDTVWNSKPWIVHDTADMTIKITTDNPWPQISKAVIYDNNGNGIGDSIAVSFPFDFPDTYTLKKANFTWPASQTAYSENITNTDLLTKRLLGFWYAPGAAAQKWTQGQSTVSVSIDSVGQTSTHAGTLEDGIGPVLWNAKVVKRYKPMPDTFRVALSEPVNVPAISGKSFILIKKSPAKKIEIEPIAGTMLNLSSDSSIQFLITDLLADAPAPGDSLQILSTGPVADKLNNKTHKDNTPVPLAFINSNVPVDKAYYYDIDGDGIVDRARLEFKDTVADINELVFDVSWTDIGVSARSVPAAFEPGSIKTIVLDLHNAFNNSAEIRDKTGGDMECTATYTATASTAVYGVIDKAGPVITKATCYLSKFITAKRAETDRLVVQFSENISNINSLKPFLLKTQGGAGYYLELLQTEKTASTATFTVTAILGVKTMADGDSIWINENENVQDAAATPQAVKNNKRVELVIIRPPFELTPYVIGPTEPSNKAIPQSFQISNGRICRGTVIILEPDIYVPLNILSTVVCKIRIFDAVGNELASCDGFTDNNDLAAISPLQKGPNNMIVILWSDLNFQKRSVGEGAYLGIIDIVYPDARKSGKKVVIPIKG